MSTALYHCLPHIFSGLSRRCGSACAAMRVGLSVMAFSVTGLSGCPIFPKTELVAAFAVVHTRLSQALLEWMPAQPTV